MYLFIPPLLLTANAAPSCKDLNPNTDSVIHPDSDPACGTGGALAVPPNCMCQYLMNDKDERGCPINYYVQCTLLNEPNKEEKPRDEFVVSDAVSGYGSPAAKPKEAQHIVPCDFARWEALNEQKFVPDIAVPLCNDDGTYDAAQCFFGGCHCVDPETGIKIPGSGMGPQTSLIDARAKCAGQGQPSTQTKCQREREAALAQVAMIPDLPVPGCTADGKFVKTQCPFPAGCRCVDPETGETIPGSAMGPEVPFTDAQAKCEGGQAQQPRTKCQQERDEALAQVEMIPDLPVPRCTKDGKFVKTQCAFPACRCVDPETGETIPGSAMGPEVPFIDAQAKCEGGQANQPKTKCQQERDEALGQVEMIPDLPVPRCTKDGKYVKTQCAFPACRCVDPDTGETIPGSAMGPEVPFTDAQAKCEGGQAQQPRTKLVGDAASGYGTPAAVPPAVRESEEAPKQHIVPCDFARWEALNEQKFVPDIPVPLCNDDGTYEAAQCFFGGCHCVDPETGIKIPGSGMGPETSLIDARAKCAGQGQPSTQTKCQQEREAALAQVAMIPDLPVPGCTADGEFVNTQCAFPAGCRCVDPETGETIPGSAMGPEVPFMDAQAKCEGGQANQPKTKCQQERDEALTQVQMIPDLPVPRCTKDGKFVKTQCAFPAVCRCVDPETGETIPGSVMGPEVPFMDVQAKCEGGQANQPKTKCQQERDEALAQVEIIADIPIPGCTEDGKFVKTQCPFPAGCRCVDPETGEIIPGSHMRPEILFPDAQSKCEGGQAQQPKTKCQQEREEALAQVAMIPDLPVPGCTADGKFVKTQRAFPAGCRCVDPETGETIPGSAMGPEVPFMDAQNKCEGGQANQPKTKCQQERDEALAQVQMIPDLPVPSCTDNGGYNALQCHAPTGQCWCVDSSGVEVGGTRVEAGQSLPCAPRNLDTDQSPRMGVPPSVQASGYGK